tara:strand:+ start:413 stop:1198 length:786 start_codon:yes stop_codon:yes gene_type:complete
MKKIDLKKLIVIKAGSSLTTLSSGLPNLKFIKSISVQIYRLYKKGFHIVLVSSGAIAQGMKIWNLSSKPKSVDFLQALSASGQIGLINNYQKEFERFDLIAAQVLLSHSDFGVKNRSENAKNSISNLIKLGAIPIINENDSISTEEILNGDNDRLSGKVATLLGSKRLIILTDQNGLFDKNPDKNKDAKLISKINLNKFDFKGISFGDSGILGRGGMTTKLKAAREYLNKNNEVWILNGNEEGVIEKVIQKKSFGTKIYLT